MGFDNVFLRVFCALTTFCACLCLAAPSTAGVDCAEGVSAAQFVGDPLGDWLYRVDVTWNSGTQNGLSHLDILFGACSCEDLTYFGVSDTSGYSTGTAGGSPCIAYYGTGKLLCRDPSIPGAVGPLVKFEHFDDCLPGPTGTGTFWFYSDFPPADVSTPNDAIAIKAGTARCFGQITGQLPSCEFNAAQMESWGRVKGIFR